MGDHVTRVLGVDVSKSWLDLASTASDQVQRIARRMVILCEQLFIQHCGLDDRDLQQHEQIGDDFGDAFVPGYFPEHHAYEVDASLV